MTQTAPTHHFNWVDCLRGLAAMVIVIYHYHHFYLADAVDRPALPAIETFPYAAIVAPFYGEWAKYAVQLFWVISGFVFLHVYYSRAVSAREFVGARIARLYPLHVLTLIFVALLQSLSLWLTGHWQIYENNDLWHFTLQLFMASNWPTFSWGLSFNGPIWSVSLEVIAYLLFFLALPLIRRAPVMVCLLICGLCWGQFLLRSEPVFYVSLSVFECAGYFFLGSTLYGLKLHECARTRILVICICAVLSTLGALNGLELMVVAGIASLVLLIFVSLDVICSSAFAWLKTLGDISYSLYLTHVPLQMVLLLICDLMFDQSRAFASSYLTLPIYLMTSILVALAVHRYFERPVGQLLRQALRKTTTNGT